MQQANSGTRTPPPIQQKFREVSSKTTHFVTWCLFGSEDPSYDSLVVEQLPVPSSTASLTGLRGVAALFVYHFHLIAKSFPDGVDPFVSWHTSSVLQLPVIRIIYAGDRMVSLFFLISGVVLSIKPLRLAGQGKWAEFSKSLTSSIFRRAPRLFLPCIPSTILSMVAIYLGLSSDQVPIAPNNLWANFLHWMSFFYYVINIWSFQPKCPDLCYGLHLWTIPIEFRDSMVLFLVLMGTAGLHPNAFGVVNIALCLFFLTDNKSDISLFLAGMLMAYYFDCLRLASLRREIRGAFELAALPIGVYLTSLPSGGDRGSLWFCSAGQMGTGIGLLLIMWSAAFNNSVRLILMSKPILYLGDISFSFYIIHEPILHMIGWPMVSWVTGKVGGSWALGITCTWILLTPLLFFLASLYRRYVEKPSLALGRWLESRYFTDFDSNQDVRPELLDLISG